MPVALAPTCSCPLPTHPPSPARPAAIVAYCAIRSRHEAQHERGDTVVAPAHVARWGADGAMKWASLWCDEEQTELNGAGGSEKQREVPPQAGNR